MGMDMERYPATRDISASAWYKPVFVASDKAEPWMVVNALVAECGTV
jgi:hypothetical protein